MEPRELVQQLATPGRLDAMRALVGGVNARDLRGISVAPAVFDALVDGLRDTDPQIRWWCLQMLDHLDDPRAVAAISTCLDDPVPRVRRNAAHALGCVGCKPTWDGVLPDGVADRLVAMAESDDNAKVRASAAQALSCAVRSPAAS